MIRVFVLIGIGIVALTHTAPTPFVLDKMTGDRAVNSGTARGFSFGTVCQNDK